LKKTNICLSYYMCIDQSIDPTLNSRAGVDKNNPGQLRGFYWEKLPISFQIIQNVKIDPGNNVWEMRLFRVFWVSVPLCIRHFGGVSKRSCQNVPASRSPVRTWSDSGKQGSLTKTVRTYTKSFKTSPLDGAGWYNW
jgi:hypothetical protein